MSNHIHCEACRHYLGGGCCRINLEPECREGGGYEAWEDSGKTNTAEKNGNRVSGRSDDLWYL